MFSRLAVIGSTLALVALPLQAFAATPDIDDVTFSKNFDNVTVTLDAPLSQPAYLNFTIYHENDDMALGDGAVKFGTWAGNALTMGGMKSRFEQYGGVGTTFEVEFAVCSADPNIDASSCGASMTETITYKPTVELPKIMGAQFTNRMDRAVIRLSQVPDSSVAIGFEIYRGSSTQVVRDGAVVASSIKAQIDGFNSQFDLAGGKRTYKVKFAVCPLHGSYPSSGIGSDCGATVTKVIRYQPKKVR